MENIQNKDRSKDDIQMAENEQKECFCLSESGKKMVALIVRIIVNVTWRECHEKGNQISEIQR